MKARIKRSNSYYLITFFLNGQRKESYYTCLNDAKKAFIQMSDSDAHDVKLCHYSCDEYEVYYE